MPVASYTYSQPFDRSLRLARRPSMSSASPVSITKLYPHNTTLSRLRMCKVDPTNPGDRYNSKLRLTRLLLQIIQPLPALMDRLDVLMQLILHFFYSFLCFLDLVHLRVRSFGSLNIFSRRLGRFIWIGGEGLMLEIPR